MPPRVGEIPAGATKQSQMLVYVMTVKQSKTFRTPNKKLTALALTWPHENLIDF